MAPSPSVWFSEHTHPLASAVLDLLRQAGWHVAPQPEAATWAVGFLPLGPHDGAQEPSHVVELRHQIARLLDQLAPISQPLWVVPAHRLGAPGSLPSDPWGQAAQWVASSWPQAHIARVYDPWDTQGPSLGGVVDTLKHQLSLGPLTTADHGYAARYPVHLDDAAEAMVHILSQGPPTRAPQRWDIAAPEPVLVRDLVQRLGGTLADGAEIPIPSTRVQPDPSPLLALGWSPSREVPACPSPPGPLRAIRPYYPVDDALLSDFGHALNIGHASNDGPHVRALEQEAALAFGGSDLLAMSSGASGLEVGLRALLSPSPRGGIALLPSWTYVATLNAIEICGLRPVLLDVDPDTWTLSTQQVRQALDLHDDVRVVIPVNVYGVHPDLDALRQLTAPRGIPLLYDAAHAVGSRYRGQAIPTACDLTVFSLHATKVLPATEGGLIAVGDPVVRERVRAIRAHGIGPDPLDQQTGTNAKMDELAAATARRSLRDLAAQLARRRVAFSRLRDTLHRAGWQLQAVPDDQIPNGQNLVACPPVPRSEAGQELTRRGIGWRPYFHPPLHRLRRLGATTALPHTEHLERHAMCLPLHARMTQAELEYLEQVITDIGAMAP